MHGVREEHETLNVLGAVGLAIALWILSIYLGPREWASRLSSLLAVAAACAAATAWGSNLVGKTMLSGRLLSAVGLLGTLAFASSVLLFVFLPDGETEADIGLTALILAGGIAMLTSAVAAKASNR